VIDTNVLIFDTFEDSQFHKEASSGLDSISKWILPTIVFHELMWFFRSREIQLSKARLKIEEYLTNEKCQFTHCTADDIRFAVSRLDNYKNYNDFVILSIAKRLESPIYTFDGDLKKIAARNRVEVLKA